MKSDMENRIDNYFREGLDDLNVIPPAEVWENISGKLAKKRKKPPIFLWIAAAASISVFAAVSGWWFFKNQEISNPKNTAIAVKHENKENQDAVAATKSQGNQQNASGNIRNAQSNILERNSKKETNSVDDYKSQEKIVAVITGKTIKTNQPSKYSNLSVNQSAENQIVFGVVKRHSVNATTDEPVLVESKLAFLHRKQLNSIQQPDVDRKIGDVKTEVVKKDIIPVYDDILVADEEQPKIDHWDIGGQMAPLYSYRNVSEVNTPGVSKASINQLEKAMITYSSGVAVGYNASSRLTIQTGIYYMKMGQEMNDLSEFSSSSVKASFLGQNSANYGVTNSTGHIVSTSKEMYYDLNVINSDNKYAVGKVAYQPISRESKNVQQTFEFLEVPFLAKYKIIDRKFGVHLLGGLSTHVLVNNKAIITNSDNTQTEGKTENVQTFNYSSSVGFGMVYGLRKNLTFSVEPIFKYYLNSFNTTNDIKLHPFAFGLYSGFFFKF